jgi:hypothetical protein
MSFDAFDFWCGVFWIGTSRAKCNVIPRAPPDFGDSVASNHIPVSSPDLPPALSIIDHFVGLYSYIIVIVSVSRVSGVGQRHLGKTKYP